MKMSNKTYDTLKFISLLVLPVVTLITTLLTIFGVLDTAIAAAIVAAVDVFVGSIVKISNDAYRREYDDYGDERY